MAKYYVPIVAIRHAYLSVDAESEQDALLQGWDAINANQCRWLYETASVEKPFMQLTEEDIDWQHLPEDPRSVAVSAVNQLEIYVPQLLHTPK